MSYKTPLRPWWQIILLLPVATLHAICSPARWYCVWVDRRFG